MRSGASSRPNGAEIAQSSDFGRFTGKLQIVRGRTLRPLLIGRSVVNHASMDSLNDAILGANLAGGFDSSNGSGVHLQPDVPLDVSYSEVPDASGRRFLAKVGKKQLAIGVSVMGLVMASLVWRFTHRAPESEFNLDTPAVLADNQNQVPALPGSVPAPQPAEASGGGTEATQPGQLAAADPAAPDHLPPALAALAQGMPAPASAKADQPAPPAAAPAPAAVAPSAAAPAPVAVAPVPAPASTTAAALAPTRVAVPAPVATVHVAPAGSLAPTPAPVVKETAKPAFDQGGSHLASDDQGQHQASAKRAVPAGTTRAPATLAAVGAPKEPGDSVKPFVTMDGREIGLRALTRDEITIAAGGAETKYRVNDYLPSGERIEKLDAASMVIVTDRKVIRIK